jgi:hypothetical protein
VARVILSDKSRKEKCRYGHPLIYSQRQKRVRCLTCDKIRHRKYYSANKVEISKKSVGRRLKYLYNLTETDYNDLLLKQNSQCAICGKVNSGFTLNVDHNHITKEIRGLLCRKCNFMIGLAGDDREILIRAAEYLT